VVFTAVYAQINRYEWVTFETGPQALKADKYFGTAEFCVIEREKLQLSCGTERVENTE
jgi:hypothetical protein